VSERLVVVAHSTTPVPPLPHTHTHNQCLCVLQGSGIFYAGYVLFQVPSNLMLERFGARLWLPIITSAWGLVAMACVFISGVRGCERGGGVGSGNTRAWCMQQQGACLLMLRTVAASAGCPSGPTSFYVLRLALGVAEAGAFPAIWHVCGQVCRESRESHESVWQGVTDLALLAPTATPTPAVLPGNAHHSAILGGGGFRGSQPGRGGPCSCRPAAAVRRVGPRRWVSVCDELTRCDSSAAVAELHRVPSSGPRHTC
jgi:MFS family permease